ncbi:IS110 family transposase [Rhodococcus sp. B10]|uniref:IS110 family transposase n=1 Tax=Rhodococcus sp. B10 TaxID=2695876 RepID=UPI001430CFC1|nr:IS110 family transposase [Rhodococcus sp. B10]NIL77287.1 IS110 family transposase IS1110 [Rhodococcus sp. B10]
MAADKVWAGIDIGKENHWVTAVDETGKTLLSRKVANDENAIGSIVRDVSALATTTSWAVDLTNAYATLLLTVLASAGQRVRYLTGRSVWQASAIYRGGESKTDAKDARVIADQSRMRGDDLPVLEPNDDLIVALQLLTAHRSDLVSERTRALNRLEYQLMNVCPSLDRAAQPKADRGWVELLSRYQRPAAIRRCGVSRLTKVLVSAGVRNAEAIAERAVAAAQDQAVRLPGEEVAAALVAELARHVLHLDSRIKDIDDQIEERFRRHRLADVITSLPGMGFRLGAEFLAAIGNPGRLQSGDQLAAWAGLAPVSKDSGTQTGRLRSPQRYDRRLRRVFYMSTLTAIRCDPASREFYQRKRSEGKRAPGAIISLARRRVNVMYALLRDEREWTPTAA